MEIKEKMHARFIRNQLKQQHRIPGTQLVSGLGANTGVIFAAQPPWGHSGVLYKNQQYTVTRHTEKKGKRTRSKRCCHDAHSEGRVCVEEPKRQMGLFLRINLVLYNTAGHFLPAQLLFLGLAPVRLLARCFDSKLLKWLPC